MSKINWIYFFGGSSNCGKTFDRYYKAEINGVRVEKRSTNTRTTFSIGNIDHAKVKYQSESELLTALQS
jgi:hypothetical protein